MAISTQISRLTTLRNNIRTKLISLGILPAASTSATLSECYNVLSSVTGLSAMSYTPTTTAQTIASGQYLSGAQTINAIPSAYIIPTGTSNITSNSTYDITSYANVSVNVPIPPGYIIPSGTITLSSSGMFDVGSYASADVTVTGGPSNIYLEYIGTSYYLRNASSTIPEFLCSGLRVTIHASELHLVSSIGRYAFENTSNVYLSSRVMLVSNLDAIGRQFNSCRSLLASNLDGLGGQCVFFPNLSIVPQYAFRFAGVMLSKDSLLSCTEINIEGFAQIKRGDYAFSETYDNGPRYAFDQATSERELYLPLCSTMGAAAFAECNYAYSQMHKTIVTAPLLEQIPKDCFFHNSELKTITAPKVSIIDQFAFGECKNLQSVHFSLVSYISESYTFGYYSSNTSYACSALSIVDFPILSIISGYYNFVRCTGLTSLNFPMLTTISGGANFINCTGLTSLNLSKLTTIYGSSQFLGCTGLTDLNLPMLTTISGGYIFCSCSALTTVSLSALRTISGGYMFSNCNNLSIINFPALTTIGGGNYMFASCSALTTVSFPVLVSINGNYHFANCSNLESIYLPSYQYTNNTPSMFESCYSLSTVSFPATSKISGVYMFRRCYNLISLFFLGSSVCQLGNTIASMFGSTPVSTYSTSAGRWASIFVPSSLLASYKAATNWTTISSKIFAYEDYFS